ncbi:unnamed protein product [Clonostachys byssicola]|uniref:Zn(2)-C6 fungal-type domain-containing protein n=1 Tax=Clonostachys byssicola TaxID=160290 RepID=A0A9N9V171_9HYPO|nr:unnamed protein product [Clonostachys byssicola]
MEKRGRKRTFQGCKTCRVRHIKCDEARPSCGQCRRGGHECSGYWSPLLWISQTPTGRPRADRSHEFRYPFFSETQRRQMSVEISRSLGSKSVVELLDRLDSSCQRLETRGRPVQGLTRGPFSAFSCDARDDDEDSPPGHVGLETGGASTQSPQGDVHPAALDAKENMSERDSFGLNEYASNMVELEPGSALFPPFDPAANLSDWFDTFEDSVFDPFLAPPTPTVQGPSGPMLPPVSLDESLLDTPDISMEASAVVVDNHLPAASPDPSPDRIWRCEDNATRRLSIIAPDLTPSAETILPAHSEPLIRYYRQQIYEGRFLQAKKASPWQSIFFPCALETFAELSLWRTTTKTRYALLYALLALSSFNRWSRNDDSNGVGGKSWYEVGCCYQQGAQHHLRSALATEMTGLEQARYKELLMAILAVSMISRLIHRQGLADQDIPMDARLLHHMYSYLRVTSESIGIRLQAPTDDPRREFNEPPEKNGMFCLATECYDVGLDSEEVKTPDLGYTDIHLQVQGQWHKSLYPAIYGFPEMLWTLLSQTVATAREKARIEALDPPDLALTNALRKHIEKLEKTMWAWTPTAHLFGPQQKPSTSSATEATQDLLDNPDAKALAQGLHQVIIIYYYRKVAKVSRMVIQSIVEKALDYLEPCIARINDQDLTPCIAWAVSTAACEAATSALREKALRILAAVEEQGVFLPNMPSRDTLTIRWQQQPLTEVC